MLEVQALPLGQNLLQFARIDWPGVPFFLARLLVQVGEFKLEDHGQFFAVRVTVKRRVVQRCPPGLAHRQEVFFAKSLPVHFLQVVVQLGTVGRNSRVRLFADQLDDVHAEASDPLGDPEIHHLIDLVPQGWVSPVQVRLLLGKEVKVILPDLLIVFPGTAGKSGLQVIWPLTPDVVVVLWRIRMLSGFHEPRVLVRRVVDHQVHYDPDSPLFAFRDQFFHISHGSVLRVDLLIIGNIVAIVDAWGLVDRTEPDGVNAKLLQVVQAADDPLQVANPIPVAVLERLWIDLVNDRVLPPRLLYFRNAASFIHINCT